jgi:hypothetical protein
VTRRKIRRQRMRLRLTADYAPAGIGTGATGAGGL